MKFTKLGYFAEFFIFPPLLLASTALAFLGSSAPRPLAWAIVFALGVAGWTFIEYLLHRYVFHHAPIVSALHERHHEDPRELIGTPTWATVSLAVLGVATPAWAILGFDLATAATAGMATGYLWFVFVHYAVHRWELQHDSYLYRARLRHARHHYLSESGNFGVTTPLWDIVFGTVLDARGSARRPEWKTRENVQ